MLHFKDPHPLPEMAGAGVADLESGNERGVAPIPDTRPWRIERGKPFTAFAPHVVSLPATGSADARWIRRARVHELLHVRHTPRISPDAMRAFCEALPIKEDVWQVGEDMRLHTLAYTAGMADMLAVALTPMDRKLDVMHIAALAARGDYRNAILQCLASFGAAESRYLLPYVIGRTASPMTQRQCKTTMRACFPADMRSRVFSLLKELTGTALRYRHYARDFATWHKQVSVAIEEALARLGHALEEEAREKRAAYRVDTESKLVKRGVDSVSMLEYKPKFAGKTPAISWGRMEIVNLAEKGPRWRPSLRAGRSPRRFVAEGSALHAPWRDEVDDRCFAVHRPLHGASLLVDCSGSMRLEPDDIDAIIATLPAALIGLYSAKRDAGTLAIVAARGRIASPVPHMGMIYGSCNVVDGPALEWLARQPRPRIWVCDGHVTGVGDQTDAVLSMQARSLCLTHSIIRVNDIDEAKTLATYINTHGGKLTAYPIARELV